jgi:plastocyanin
MKRKLLLVAAVVATLGAGSIAFAKTPGVQITSTGLNPRDVSIQTGDSITWTNSDTVRHRVVFDGTTCRLVLERSQESSCTFAAAGTFTYNDPNDPGTYSGSVTVAANNRAVTLAASRNVGIFGDAMRLSGTVSSKAAGEHVTVTAKPAVGPAFSYDVVTTANGNWTLQVQPRASTTYEAKWENATSKSLAINLRPRLTFQKVGRHQYLVVVLAAHSMAGKRLDIARRIGGRYVVFKRVTISSIARTSTTSVAYFVAMVPSGTHLRAFLPKSEVGAAYLDGHSNFVVQ